jgi:predicted nucleic acid-binding protein
MGLYGLKCGDFMRQFWRFYESNDNQQRAYDCLYVALAERDGIELWTGDERLYNALHAQHPFVRWIADYQRR